MSRGINRVILIGNLGADPKISSSAGGRPITTLRVATTDSWKDKATGERVERTEWHQVKLFGRRAEVAADWLRKGRQVYIEGSLRTSKYTDAQGVERYSTEVVAQELQMLGSAGSRVADAASPVPESGPLPPDGSDFDDDDIPF